MEVLIPRNTISYLIESCTVTSRAAEAQNKNKYSLMPKMNNAHIFNKSGLNHRSGDEHKTTTRYLYTYNTPNRPFPKMPPKEINEKLFALCSVYKISGPT